MLTVIIHVQVHTNTITVEPVFFSLHKTFTLEILEGPNFCDSFEARNLKFNNILIIIAPHGQQNDGNV